MVSVDSAFATYSADCHNFKNYANNKMQYVCYTILCITLCITNGDFRLFRVTQQTSVTHGRKRKTSDNPLITTRLSWAENGSLTSVFLISCSSSTSLWFRWVHFAKWDTGGDIFANHFLIGFYPSGNCFSWFTDANIVLFFVMCYQILQTFVVTL